MSGGGSGTVGAAPTSTSIVITVSSGAVVASSSVTVTLSGLIMGVASGGSSSGIAVATSADVIVSVGVESGVIGGQVSSGTFVIGDTDRVAGKTNVAATFSFTTTAGGALAIGSFNFAS